MRIPFVIIICSSTAIVLISYLVPHFHCRRNKMLWWTQTGVQHPLQNLESHHLAHLLHSRMNLTLTQSWTSHCRVFQRLIPDLQAECRLTLGHNRPGAREGKRSKPRQAGRQTQLIFFWGLSLYCTDVALCSSSWEGKQSVNKNPGASETSRERLPNYRNAAE